MKTLYIIRHGETEWNKIGRYQGITDVPLNDNGIAQAKACANALKDVHFDRILSSDLSRALVTAETIRGNRNVDITVDSRLREIDFGDWEKLLFSEIEERWPGLIDQIFPLVIVGILVKVIQQLIAYFTMVWDHRTIIF